MRFSFVTTLAMVLALMACGGGGDASGPVVQRGFGPSQLHDPVHNPAGRILQQGDTGIIFLGAAGLREIWFEVAVAATYRFDLEDEDLAIMARVEIADASGQALAWVDTTHRIASVDLTPGRHVLRMAASPTAPDEGVPLFIRFDVSGAKVAKAAADSLQARWALTGNACDGCDLKGVDLRGTQLSNVDLQRASLERADFVGANLRGAQLKDADLLQANLQQAKLHHAELIRATMRQVDLTNAILDQADLIAADMRNAIMELTRLQGADLRGVDLRGATLRGADLMGARLTDANLQNADLSGANLSGADFRGATWTDGRICLVSSLLGECR